MIETRWKERGYNPARVEKRYVKREPDGGFTWIETATKGKNAWKWDIRSGTCAAEDLPQAVQREAADVRERGVWPFYVEWPLGG